MLFRISIALDLDSSLLDAAKASHESAKLTWPPVNKCGKREKTTHTKWLSVRILRKLLFELEGFTFNDSSLYYFCYFNNHCKHRCMVKIVESSFNCNLLYEFMQLELIQPEGYKSQLCNYCADKIYCISVFVETSVKTMKPWILLIETTHGNMILKEAVWSWLLISTRSESLPRALGIYHGCWFHAPAHYIFLYFHANCKQLFCWETFSWLKLDTV